MTPQDKAKELYDKFYPLVDRHDSQWNDPERYAKECALITVREIFSNGMSGTPNHWYWNEVMNEINKL